MLVPWKESFDVVNDMLMSMLSTAATVNVDPLSPLGITAPSFLHNSETVLAILFNVATK